MKQTYPQCAQGAGRGLIIDDGRVLLVRGNGDGTFWTIPGGRSDLGEDIKSCIVREVYEETGLRIDLGPFFAATEFYDETIGFHVLEMIFICSLQNGSTLPENWVDHDGPIKEARFFTLDEVRALKFLSPEFLRLGEWLNPPENNVYRGIERKSLRQST